MLKTDASSLGLSPKASWVCGRILRDSLSICEPWRKFTSALQTGDPTPYPTRVLVHVLACQPASTPVPHLKVVWWALEIFCIWFQRQAQQSVAPVASAGCIILGLKTGASSFTVEERLLCFLIISPALHV